MGPLVSCDNHATDWVRWLFFTIFCTFFFLGFFVGEELTGGLYNEISQCETEHQVVGDAHPLIEKQMFVYVCLLEDLEAIYYSLKVTILIPGFRAHIYPYISCLYQQRAWSPRVRFPAKFTAGGLVPCCLSSFCQSGHFTQASRQVSWHSLPKRASSNQVGMC